MENKHLNSHYFKVTTLAPVHVGSGRKYMQGLDFIYKEGSLLFLNNDAIWKAFPAKLSAISKNMADGNIRAVEELYDSLNILSNPKNILFKAKFPFRINEIFQMINDGFNRPMIPGSSIKGSLRSIILNKLYSENPGRELNEKNLVGNIDDSLFKYLQVTDTTWKSRTVLPVKVFSGDLGGQGNHDSGQWKDAFRGSHNIEFRENAFTSGYEVIPENKVSYCRINYPSQEKAHTVQRYDRAVIGMQFFQNYDLVTVARNYMNNYLTKEIAFFNHFENTGLLDEDGGNVISSYLDWLLEENSNPNCFLLRVGGGSGYYSVSGDWKHRDHIVTERDFRTRQEKLPAKTRKLSFQSIEEGYDFLPLGFLLFEEIPHEVYNEKTQ